MGYFDHAGDRKGTDSHKWGQLPKFCPGVEDALPFWVADMEFEVMPEIREALEERLAKPIYSYTMATDRFYDNIIRRYERFYGLELKREDIWPVPGVMYALSSILEALTEKGDGVIVNTPCYQNFLKMVEKLDRKLIESPLKDTGSRFEMDFEDIEAAMQKGAKAFLLCSPHNPTGRVWSREELLRLVELCEDYDVTLICDEIHSDLVYGEKPHIPILGVKPETGARIVMTNAPSKSFNFVLHTGYILCREPETRARLWRYLDGYETDANGFGILSQNVAYEKGDAWLFELRSVLKENARLAKEYFAENIPGVKMYMPEGTFLLWLNLRAYGLPAAEIMRRLGAAGAALCDGSQYGKGMEGFVRMNIGCPKDMLEEGLRRMKKAFADLPQKPSFEAKNNRPVCVYGPPSWFAPGGKARKNTVGKL